MVEGKNPVRVVFNTSPLIFLAKLDFIKQAVSLFECYLPKMVMEEIKAKEDSPHHQYAKDVRGTIRKAAEHMHIFPRGQGHHHQDQPKEPPPTSKEKKKDCGQQDRRTDHPFHKA